MREELGPQVLNLAKNYGRRSTHRFGPTRAPGRRSAGRRCDTDVPQTYFHSCVLERLPLGRLLGHRERVQHWENDSGRSGRSPSFLLSLRRDAPSLSPFRLYRSSRLSLLVCARSVYPNIYRNVTTNTVHFYPMHVSYGGRDFAASRNDNRTKRLPQNKRTR